MARPRAKAKPAPPLPPRVFCDTSFFYACLDPDDVSHEQAKRLVVQAAEHGTAFYCTWDIISETVTLLRYRKSFALALTFLNEVKPTLRIMPYDDSVRQQAEEVFRRLGMDKRLSYCDAISFVVVTTLLDNVPCFSFDRDFKRLGLTVIR